MDDQKLWNIINSHFKDNHQRLVMHHIDSYNDFFENKIYDIFREENPISIVSVYDEKNDSYRNNCDLYLGGKNGKKIYFGKPVLYDNDEGKYMYPNDSRLRNMSYSMTIHYDVEIVFKKVLKDGESPIVIGGNYEYINPKNIKNKNVKEQEYIEGEEEEEQEGGAPRQNKKLQALNLTAMETQRLRELTEKSLTGNIQEFTMTLEKIYLGKFPIMLQSNFCILSGLPKEIRSTFGECRNDYGGYFIIDGKEKTVVSQEKFADNMLYIKKMNDDKHLYSAELKSVSENVSKPKRTISIRIVAPTKTQSNLNIVVNVPQVKKPVPLFILFRALGVISDKDIINHCLLDTNKYSNYMDLFIPSVHDSGGIFTQRMAIKYIASLTKWRTSTYALEILNDYLFPHIGETVYKQKALYLGYIVKKLLDVYTGKELETDRDNYKYKRIELIGSLLNDLFLDYYKIQNKKIFQYFDTVLNTNRSIYENDLYSLINLNYKNALSKRIVEKGFHDAFKGTWGSDPKSRRVGVVQDLNRLSHNAMLSHLRKTNLPLDPTAKIVGPRLLNGSQWGYFDPVDTPDGGNIGLHKHLAISTYITKGVSKNPFILWAIKNISLKLIEDCSFHELDVNTKVMINGCWIGMIIEPIKCSNKIKLYRRNALLPIYISVTFNILNNVMYIYTDSGRLSRPLFYVDNNKLSYENTKILNKLESNDFKWNDLICGINSKSDQDFNPNNYKFYELNELYNVTNSETDIFKHKRFTEDKCIIEYIDSSETEDTYIALNTEEYKKENRNYTHLEIHESFILGVMGNLIIYPENNPGTRNMFSCGQSRQACSLYSTNYQNRMDKTSVVLNNAQIPIVKSRYMEHINSEENCYGENLIVAIMCYTGYNVEDAVLINEASIKRGLFNTTYYSCYETHEEKSVTNESTIETLFQNIEDTDNLVGKKLGHDYSKLNKYGIINENELVDEKSIIIGIVSNNSEDKDKKFDLSKKPKKGQIGFVDKSFISENDAGQRIAKVKIREFRTPKIGDKMGSRCGQKGTVGLIIPERDMPFNKDGQKPDMIINPHAIPSRMTIGQLIETITGKSGLMRGGFIDSTAFITKNNKFNLFAELLVKDGFHSSGTELFYNGFTGQQISSEIFVGPTYYMRLKHMVKDKINFRSFGKNAKLTKQPVSGRANDGGLRIGEMERDVLISHGTSNFLTESMMERGDKYYMAVCNKSGMIAAYNEDTDIYYSLLSDGPMEFTNITKFDCDMIQKTKFGRDFSIVRIPYTFKLLIQELGACNIQIRVITQDNINNIEDLSYSKNINKLLDIDNNVPMENVLNHIINENNKKNNARVNDNKFTKPTKDDEAYRNNPYIVSYLEKFPDDSIEDALNDYNNFLLNGQGKLYIDEELIKLGWTQQYSETKNKTYWFNTNTGESSWTKPIVKTEIPVIEDDDESVPWAPDEDFDSINTVDSNKSSIPYATEEIERMNIENTDSKFKLNDNVHLRGDSKQTRIWVIKNIADKFITIITDDNEGLISDEMTRVITEPEIFKVDDYSYNLPETLGGKSAPVPDMQNNMPVVNIAPVFKIVNGDNAENNAATEEVPIIDNNGLTNTSDLMNFKPTLDSNVTQEQEPQEITDKSKIDFNKLVIKKV
jgi:DNA-directed RNA polymerase II subunit RPB2